MWGGSGCQILDIHHNIMILIHVILICRFEFFLSSSLYLNLNRKQKNALISVRDYCATCSCAYSIHCSQHWLNVNFALWLLKLYDNFPLHLALHCAMAQNWWQFNERKHNNAQYTIAFKSISLVAAPPKTKMIPTKCHFVCLVILNSSRCVVQLKHWMICSAASKYAAFYIEIRNGPLNFLIK